MHDRLERDSLIEDIMPQEFDWGVLIRTGAAQLQEAGLDVSTGPARCLVEAARPVLENRSIISHIGALKFQTH